MGLTLFTGVDDTGDKYRGPIDPQTHIMHLQSFTFVISYRAELETLFRISQ